MEDMLMVKLFFGENHKREDIVQDALARLDMIAANDPDVMAARIRYLVRHGRIDDARSATQRLAEHAPGSAALKSAQTSLMLATPEGRQQLQKARLLATSGHTAEALVAYRALFSGAFPSDALALEYWRVVAHTPDGKAEAIERLEVLNRDHPGNNELRLTLAGLLFSVQRSAEGFQILRPLAQSEQNREDAADMWFTQIQDMPESENRLTALKDFVTLFQTGRSADLARRMLVTETAQWLDPAFRARMHGLQNVTANNVALAEPDLRRALAQSPDDGEILGAMGIVESRRGQRARAVNLLSRAISLEPNSSNRSKWESLLQTNRYWLLINSGDAVLAVGQFAQAGLKYRQASMLDREDTFGSDSDGGYTPLWATCSTAVCHGQTHQDAMGVSLAAGWFNRTWQGDIGTTPIGMKVVTIAGGGSYRGRMGPLGFILNVHHRPLTNSLLSFGGQRDPNTGKIWGGVRATGVTWNLSYDTGGRNGVWASPGIDLLTGQNVGNNWRARWMAGYYYKIINEPNRRVTIGLSNMLWHYAQDASGYTLGRGGYYSPQEYLSFSVPVWWRQRTHYWSWEVGASISWSTSSTSSSRRYPIQRLLDGVHSSTFTDRDAIESGGSSSGLGYTAQAVIERRINPHFSVGAGIDIQEARNYTPSHAFVFLHYFQHVWDGDMDIPPQPLIPYAQW